MTVTHAFVSAKDDGGDDTLVRPSDWNAEHIVEGLESGGGGTAFLGVRANASVQAISATTWTPVAFANESIDTNAFHSTVTNNSRFTVPAGLDGKYFVAFDVLFDANNATGSLYATVYKNGANDSYNFRVPADNNTGADVGASRSMVMDLVAGDYVELYVFVDIARNVDGALFSMFKIGSGSLGDPPGVRLYRAASQTISNNTATEMLWTNEEWDTNGYHSTSVDTGRITIPAGYGGKYLIHSEIRWNYTGAVEHWLTKNGASVRGGDMGATELLTANLGVTFLSLVLDLAAGDYIKVNVYQNSGSSKEAGGGGGAFNEPTFSAVRIGGTGAADGVSYDPTSSGLAATDVQEAIDEIAEGGHALGFVGFSGTGASITVPTGTYPGSPFPITTEVFDTDGFHDPVTNTSRITVPAGLGGKYLLNIWVEWVSNSSGERIAYYHVNGSAGYFISRIQSNATFDTAHGGAVVLSLNAGDYVEVSGYHTRGSDLNVQAFRVQLYKIDTPALGGPPGARAFHSTTQGSLGSGAVNALSLNSEDWDTDGYHDTVTNNSRFTVPAGLGGKYLLVGHTNMDVAFQPYWKKNGATISSVSFTASANEGGEVINVEDLVAGDYVEFCEFHASGTGTAGHASARHVQTEATITRFGGSVGEIQSQGTAFPTGPATNDRYFRTDRGLEYYWDGTRWLTVNEYVVSWLTRTAFNGITVQSTIAHALVDTGSIYVTTYEMATFVSSGNDGSNYWVIILQKNTVANVGSTVGSISTQSNTNANWVIETATVNAVVDGTTHPAFYLIATPTASPGGLFGGCTVRYRRIG